MKRVKATHGSPFIRVLLIILLALIGYDVSVANAEEEIPRKVLTVGALGGMEADVGDAVLANLETGTKVQLVKSNGEITCNESAIKGKITNNPTVGVENAEIEVESFTFQTCSSTIGGAGGTVRELAIEQLPLTITTQGKEQIKMTHGGIEMGLKIAVETPAHEEIRCIFRASPLFAKYENNNGEIEIAGTVGPGFQAGRNCQCNNASPPNWKAKYRLFQDETGANKGERIFIN
jgi:hypothetical protein